MKNTDRLRKEAAERDFNALQEQLVGQHGLVNEADSWDKKFVDSTATKFDTEKAARPELLPPAPLLEISKVLAHGAIKYDQYNWTKGFKWSRLIGSSLRHLYAWMGGEDKDPESGLSHLSHLGCNVLFLLEHELKGLGTDDRYKGAEGEEDVQTEVGTEQVGAEETEDTERFDGYSRPGEYVRGRPYRD